MKSQVFAGGAPLSWNGPPVNLLIPLPRECSMGKGLGSCDWGACSAWAHVGTGRSHPLSLWHRFSPQSLLETRAETCMVQRALSRVNKPTSKAPLCRVPFMSQPWVAQWQWWWADQLWPVLGWGRKTLKGLAGDGTVPCLCTASTCDRVFQNNTLLPPKSNETETGEIWIRSVFSWWCCTKPPSWF